MSRAERFVENWFLENYHFEGYPEPEGETDPQAEMLAADCAQAAEAEGISAKELADAIGDLPEYMRRNIERRADEHVQRQADKDD